MNLLKNFFFPLLATAIGLGCATPPVQKSSSQIQTVVLVSIDGFRPDFYLNPSFTAPHLQSLVKNGAHALQLEPIFPSVTYPNHTTLVTGVSSATHGVLSNTIFDWSHGPTIDWYWDSHFIRVKTLWQAAKEAQLTTAIVSWPVSVGAQVDWLIPETFSRGDFNPKSSWKLIVQGTTQNLMPEVLAHNSVQEITSHVDHDQFITEAASYILKSRHPNLVLMHYSNVDQIEHETGRTSPETVLAVKAVDALVGRLMNSIDFKTSALIIVGDHGFFDYNKIIRINSLFAKKGWIKSAQGQITSWKVIAHTNGGQAAIYLKDPSIKSRVMAELTKNARGLYRVIEHDQLARLKAYPQALCALSANPDSSFVEDVANSLVLKLPKMRGQHGHLPDDPRIMTGLLAVGPGIQAGTVIERARLLDIAPTVAKLLGFSLPLAEGNPLKFSP